ncbi:DNA polymerase lambda [Aulographum hederae CBS 113979]|uniref:DNA polymerase n=1 Tax=Aulographum hederae CBS 113979 TaxID=1176131 RepID=A0A6G1H8I1_9PEZI|nr:DNA polymerase lambda [Aulographum hederae CBS 113979]
MPVSSLPRDSVKRKRGESYKLAPENRRIFKDLNIFFFPNNDINPLRRMRMWKAIEYGASWIQKWQDGITHIVADRSATYQHLLDFLQVPSVPDSVVVVHEQYMSDCISFAVLIDPDRPAYRLKGCPVHANASDVNPAPGPLKNIEDQMPSSQSSLQLKAPAPAREPQTPSRKDDSSRETSQASHNQGSSPTKTNNDRPQYNDALDAAIDEAKTLQHIPFDFEEDDQHEAEKDETSDIDTEEEGQRLKKPAKRRKAQGNETFSCMSKHDGSNRDSNPNSRTIELLQEMGKYYDQIHDQWRTLAYRRAVASLRKQTEKIVSKEQAFQLPFVGERLAAKIEEIIWTDRLQRLENARLEPSDHAIRLFLGIYGVGFSQASRWVTAGFKTLEDLENKATLTANQTIGLAHYDDFQTRIPRAEIEEHGVFVRKALQEIDATFEITIGGSYRRGAKDSGDIDVLITKPEIGIHYIRSTVVERLVPKLFEEGFLKAGLATTHKDTGTKWHGACAIPGSEVWRRIDLLLVPWDEMGAALIYFTGNDIFNRSIRLLASKKGMRLNQRGLYKDVIREPLRQRVTEGTLLENKSEEKIFEILGVPWRPPHHRIA